MRSKLFALLTALMLASMLLAACGPAATTVAPAPTTAPVATQPPAATTAPAATAVPTVVPPTAVPTAAPVQTLRINISAWPDSIDPQTASFVNEIAHLNKVYEGLTRLDKDLNTVAGGAESWKYNADATVLDFTIRKGEKYSDGSLLNAKRYEYSILRNINPKTGGEYASITDDIKGAPEYRGADLKTIAAADLQKLHDAVGVHALDSAGKPCTGYDQADCMTLELTFSHPAPYFHVVSSLWVTYPAKQELIEKGGDTWTLDAANQIGNGPFIWKTLTVKQKSEFVPNPNYWRGKISYNLTYSYITDSAVAYAAYKNGELDSVALAAEDLKVSKADPVLSKEIDLYPGSCTFAVMFHQQKAPFDDPKVRQAFAQSLDRAGWVNDVNAGLGLPTLTWIPKGYPGYDANETRWGFDVAAAKQALADSTYKTADKLPPITLSFSDTPRNRNRFTWIANQWKQNLGVDAKLNPVEATAYTAMTKDVKTAPQVFYLGWCADYPDPQNWLSVYWMTGAFGARIGYSSPTLDALMKKADAELDTTKRLQEYGDAQKMLLDTVPVAMMMNSVNVYLVKPYVKGWNNTPQDAEYPGDTDPFSITIQK